jgi:psp operon transcriptional activator
VQNLEIELLQEALARARNNQRRAAVLLGLSYHQLRGMLRKYKEHLDS